MKTYIKKTLTIAVTGFMLSFNAVAHTSDNLNKLNTNTSKIIKEQINFPSLLMNYNKNEKVDVVFTVNELGQVNLVIANTNNQILKQTIEQQFLKLNLQQLKPNNVYSIMFNFKTI